MCTLGGMAASIILLFTCLIMCTVATAPLHSAKCISTAYGPVGLKYVHVNFMFNLQHFAIHKHRNLLRRIACGELPVFRKNNKGQ